MIDFTTLTARGLAAQVRAGLSPQAVAEAFADHAARVEPGVCAFAHQAADPTAATKGLLAGVPTGIKDVFDTFDLPTEYGSKAWAGWQPARDAASVHQLRQAGAMIAAKTVSTEFAMFAPGPTCNPHNHGHTPGGSSSGSAAALAAGLVLLALGTQTSGSTVRPASFCGVVGMKPSRGRINTTGMKPLGASLDVVGPMARDARDLALLCAVLMRAPELANLEGAMPASIGVFLPELAGVDDSASRAVIDAAAARLSGTHSVSAPKWWAALGPAQADVFAWEVSAALATEVDLHGPLLHPKTHHMMNSLSGASHKAWAAGLATRDGALADLDALFGPHDVLITQAAPGEAPEGLESTGNAGFNISWTLLGTPSLSLPAGVGPKGLPIGLQLVARPGADAQLLAAAIALEDALKLRHTAG